MKPLNDYPTPETDNAAYDVTNADAEWGQTREKSTGGSHCCADLARDLERRLALCRDALKEISETVTKGASLAREALKATEAKR